MTPFFDFVRRFGRNRAALAGLLVILAVVGFALVAPSLVPRNPLRIVGRPEIWPFLNPRFPLG
ncbi:hypothetical protein ABTH81_19930, partial [Acinetobacter baumannii]